MIKRYIFNSVPLAILLAVLPGVGLIPDSLWSDSSIAAAFGHNIVAAETVLALSMETQLSSASSKVGDPFTATVTQDVFTEGQVVIPAGSRVKGHGAVVEPARRMSRSGAIAVDFDQLILPDGRSYQIDGNLTSLDPKEQQKIDEESRISGDSTKKRSIVFIGGGAGVEAVVGVLAKGGKGAAIGTGVGAAISTAAVLLSKGHVAEVNPGTEFGLELAHRVELSRPDVQLAREDLSSTEMIRRAQRALQEQSYAPGIIDGIPGSRTQTALRNFQRAPRLPVTGQLDEQTALTLGILPDETTTDARMGSRPIKVVSACAERQSDDSIRIVIDTETPTGGWRTFGDHSTLDDRIHVWVRGAPPSGPAMQAITRGKLEVMVPNASAATDSIFVHGKERNMTMNVSAANARR